MNTQQEKKIRKLAMDKAYTVSKSWNSSTVGGKDTVIHDGNVWTVDVEMQNMTPVVRWNATTGKHDVLHQTQDGDKKIEDIIVTIALDRPYVRVERDEESEEEDDEFWVDEEGNVCVREPDEDESDDELITADEFLSEPIEN